MTESLQVVCPHCQATNRVPSERLRDTPVCGRCHQSLFTGHPLVLDGAAFSRQLQHSGIPMLVDFWADWCGPCRMMAPQFARAAGLLEPEVRLGKIDTEVEQALAGQLAIRSIPTLVLFRDGREIARSSGALSAEQIVTWTRQQLRKGN